MPHGNQTVDTEVAVMRDVKRRSPIGWIGRLLVIPSVGVSLAGCASVTSDVDAYYRQMAVNYQEAIDKAKLDEVTLQKRSRVMAVTGDQRNQGKSQRELARIRKWEDHCEWEKERFEKAAKWMESHFKIDEQAVQASLDTARRFNAAGLNSPGDTKGLGIKESPDEASAPGTVKDSGE
jgi:hypothetical protein